MYVTNTALFEAFIMLNIIAVGVSTGADLENVNEDPNVDAFVSYTGLVTTIVFTVECVLKLVAEGEYWRRYFTDPDNGNFNCMDFGIVMMSFAFMGSTNANAIGGLRMLRLARLLTFIKGVKELRVIVSGLLVGMRSVI